MKLSDKQQRIVDIIQWVIILFLLAVCIFSYINNTNQKLITSEEYRKELSYMKIYESQQIETLKKENKALYDSIKNLQNVESAIEIKYVYKHKTDTITVKEFVQLPDSVYHYEQKNDTIDYHIDIKAKDLEWMQSDFKVNDKFIIVNRELDGLNQTIVTGSQNVNIENVDAWHRKNTPKWYERFTVSPQIGVGIGLFQKKADIYVGVGIGFKF